MPGRNARQCKERWTNYLCPTLNTNSWKPEEDRLLVQKRMELGAKWVKIAQFFPNRTDAMVKNRYQVLKRKENKEKKLKLSKDPMFMKSLPYLSLYACAHATEKQDISSPEPSEISEAHEEVTSQGEDDRLYDELDMELWNDSFRFCDEMLEFF
jgi:hypothetical protein